MIKLDTFPGDMRPVDAIRESYRFNPKAQNRKGFIRAWRSKDGRLMTHFYEMVPRDMGEAILHTDLLEKEEY